MTCCVPRCPKPVADDAHVPICDAHVMLASREMYARRIGEREVRKVERDEHAVVYYVRIGEVIKIGYTSRLPERLSALRVDPSNLLALEPGAREVEKERHHQFRSIRVTSKREDFWPHEPLLTHIRYLQATHPQPRHLPDTRTVTVRKS